MYSNANLTNLTFIDSSLQVMCNYELCLFIKQEGRDGMNVEGHNVTY